MPYDTIYGNVPGRMHPAGSNHAERRYFHQAKTQRHRTNGACRARAETHRHVALACSDVSVKRPGVLSPPRSLCADRQRDGFHADHPGRRDRRARGRIPPSCGHCALGSGERKDGQRRARSMVWAAFAANVLLAGHLHMVGVLPRNGKLSWNGVPAALVATLHLVAASMTGNLVASLASVQISPQRHKRFGAPGGRESVPVCRRSGQGSRGSESQ